MSVRVLSLQKETPPSSSPFSPLQSAGWYAEEHGKDFLVD